MDFLFKKFTYDTKSNVTGLSSELSIMYYYNYYVNNDKFVLIVTDTLYEANGIYKKLKNYTDDVCLFPCDDFLASVVLAVSPDLKVMRLETLDKINNSKKLIVITHLMGYLKYLPSKNVFNDSILTIKKNNTYERKTLINTIENLGYNKTSIVGTTGEYAVRGFIIDIFPIRSEHPIRIEFFDDIVESIREFDSESQRSLNDMDNVTIKQFDELISTSNSSLVDYLNNPFIFFINYDQIMKTYNNLLIQINEYKQSEKKPNEKFMYTFDEIKITNYININTINNYKADIDYNSKEIEKFYGDYEKLQNFCNNNKDKKKIVLFLSNDKQIDIISKLLTNIKINTVPELNSITIIKHKISNGFTYEDYYVLSEFDIDDIEETTTFKNPYKLGKKIKSFDDIKVGDYVVHSINGIGIYGGITAISKSGIVKDYIMIKYLGNDKIYVPVEKINTIYKYASSDSNPPRLNKLGSYTWTKTKNTVKKKISDISKSLIELYAKRSKSKKESFKHYEEEDIFASSFEYIPTKDQEKCINDILSDLSKTIPMDRLLCGDVGFGKTEVAFRAIYNTIINGYQVAYLCPTTILSRQQYTNALKRFKGNPINIALLNRYTSNKDTNKIFEDLENGKIDLIFGTHKLLNKNIKYKNLGLLIIDEEQRFGVAQKEKLKSIKENISVLTLSATPIPRTLKMAMSGLRDISIIDTPPINRYPVQTYVLEENDIVIKDAIYKELMRNGQVFILYNSVETILEEVNRIKELVKEARVTFAHGKMNKHTSEKVIEDFINYKYDVLVCTTIIETGIDIQNVNTLIIKDAENFGLSQLYQLRGRVGRSDRIAYAYLMYKKNKILNSNAIKRLQAIKDFTELGSGYKIALRDLSIRGAGDLLGSEQAGFVDSVGIELYTQMVEDEINRLNGIDVVEEDNTPLLEVNNHIEDSYVTEENIKIEIHKMINKIHDEQSLIDVKNELQDRFGNINDDINNYMYEVLFENLAKQINIFKVTQTRKDITITLSEEYSNSIEGDKLLIITYNINPKFRISYFNKKINITLPIINLDKHFIYYEVKLLEDLIKMNS